MGLFGKGGVSKQTQALQALQQQQAAKAASDQAQVQKMSDEDQKATARRASMGLLSNILSNPGQKNQTLGG